jgi:hypothetical protein
MSQWLVVNAKHFVGPMTLLMVAFALYNSFNAKRQKRGETVRGNPYIIGGAPVLLCAMGFFLGIIVTH